ncbi:MAG: M23 family metallopeptidase [Candidatus Babeliaceae bacterium]
MRKSAISFAKKHNLATVVERLYEAEEIVVGNKRSTRKRSVQKRNSGRKKIRSSIHELPQLYRATDHDMIFQWPIEKHAFWLSSPFGSRKKPNGTWRFHTGIDMAAIRGTSVKAAAAGHVVEAYYDKGYGNTVLIMHSRSVKTRYAHLAKIVVVAGQKVETGQMIGTVGNTGHTYSHKRGHDTSHLHFEIHVHGKKVNPLYYMR